MSRGALLVAGLILALTLVQPAGAEHTPPYVVHREFEGFIECAVGLVVFSVQACSIVSPNTQFILDWEVQHDLRTVDVTLDWEPTVPLGDDHLLLLFHEGVCQDIGCQDAYSYIDQEVLPGTTIRIQDNDIADPAHRWSALGDGSPLMVRVFPSQSVDVVVRQAFTLTVTEHYVHPAP